MKDEDIFIPAEEKLATPEGVRQRRSPQEKKELSYKKDRRNTYGENSKSSRKNIPAKRARKHRRDRRKATEDLSPLNSEVIDVTKAEEAQDKIRARRETRADWASKKWPDTPLGEVLAWKDEPQTTASQNRARRKKEKQAIKKARGRAFIQFEHTFSSKGFFGRLKTGRFSDKHSKDPLAQLQYWDADWFNERKPDEALLELVARAINILNTSAVKISLENQELFKIRYEHFRLEFTRLLDTPQWRGATPKRNTQLLAKLHSPSKLAKTLAFKKDEPATFDKSK